MHRCYIRSFSSAPRAGLSVGFIGLGNMGYPMALNLLRKRPDGKENLLVMDMNPQTLARAQQDELSIASSVTELADCDVIFTMLPGCAAVHATMNTLLEHEKAKTARTENKIFVDCSTVSPATSRHWNELWRTEYGYTFLDAPVSGGVKGATEGTLTFMVGGCNDDVVGAFQGRIQPLLECMASRVILCGAAAGAGAATKLCNNLALATQMIGICEAMNLGTALDVDPVVLANVMNISTAGCWSSRVNNPHPAVAASLPAPQPPAAHSYQGGFGTKLMLKDLGLAVAAAQQVGSPSPLTSLSRELYSLADAHGLGDKDFGVMLQFLKGRHEEKGEKK